MIASPLPLKALTSGEQQATWRSRLFRFACYLYNVKLPGSPKCSLVGGLLQTAAIIAFIVGQLAVLLYLSDYILLAFNHALQAFLNGFIQPGDAASAPMQYNPSALRALLMVIWMFCTMWTQSLVQRKALALTGTQLALERERAARQEAESTLRMLKAQIEPHFLFNTLGTVQQMAEAKAPEAAALTADLIVFLRSTLASLRADSATLAEELATCESYLRVMQSRLTRRLAFAIDCPPDLQAMRMPTSVLLTLTENAIKHGIEPAPAGGRIDIAVRREADRVVILVADTGCGFGDNVGQGLGLQNVRERIALAYGDGAALNLEANEPSGVVARLTLPYQA